MRSKIDLSTREYYLAFLSTAAGDSTAELRSTSAFHDSLSECFARQVAGSIDIPHHSGVVHGDPSDTRAMPRDEIARAPVALQQEQSPPPFRAEPDWISTRSLISRHADRVRAGDDRGDFRDGVRLDERHVAQCNDPTRRGPRRRDPRRNAVTDAALGIRAGDYVKAKRSQPRRKFVMPRSHDRDAVRQRGQERPRRGFNHGRRRIEWM
jgi:hypothetical protein